MELIKYFHEAGLAFVTIAIGKDLPVIRLGTTYGGWYILDSPKMTGRDYILAGVGEDVSFDIELITRYSGKGYLIDPTPRACKHISQIRSRFGVLNYHSYSENTGIQKVSAYNLGSINDENFLHYPYVVEAR